MVDRITAPGQGSPFAFDTNPGDGNAYPLTKIVWGSLHSGYTIVDATNGLPVQDTVVETAVGAPADAAYVGSGASSIIAALKGLYAKLGAVVLSAGSAVIGKVGIDQTTPGTTNAIADATESVAAAQIAAASVTSATNLFSVDTTGYNSIAVQVTSAGTTCTITYEASEDNTNWVNAVGYSPNNNGNTAPSSTSTTAQIFVFPCIARYFRARVSTYTSGTVTALATLRRGVPPPMGIFAQGNISLTKTATVANAQVLTTTTRIQSAATTNATNLKASGTIVGCIAVQNNGASAAYLKLYNKATAPTVGTDTPHATFLIPAGGCLPTIEPAASLSFNTGLGYAITGGPADTDTTAVAANQVTGFMAWA